MTIRLAADEWLSPSVELDQRQALGLKRRWREDAGSGARATKRTDGLGEELAQLEGCQKIPFALAHCLVGPAAVPAHGFAVSASGVYFCASQRSWNT